MPMSGPPSSAEPYSVMAAGETWPTKSWSSQRGTARAARDGACGVDLARCRDDPAQAAVGAQVAGERTGIDARDRRDAVVAQERRELAGILEHGRGGVSDDERPQPRLRATGRRRPADRSCR